MGERDKVEPFWSRPSRTKRRGPSLTVPERAPPESEPSAPPSATPADAPQEPSFAISRQQRRETIAAIIGESLPPPTPDPAGDSEARRAPSFGEARAPAEPDAHGWVRLSAGEAARHPLYGVHGWLVLVAVFMAFELFRALAEILDFWATTDHGGLAAWIMAVLRSVMAVWAALILGLLLGCSRAFPISFVAYAMVNVLYLGLFALAFAHVTKGTVFIGMAVGMALNLVAIAYVLRSRRVNVTCRHRMRVKKSRPPKEGGTASTAAPAAA